MMQIIVNVREFHAASIVVTSAEVKLLVVEPELLPSPWVLSAQQSMKSCFPVELSTSSLQMSEGGYIAREKGSII